MLPIPNDSEITDYRSGNPERRVNAVRRFRDRTGLHIADANKGMRLYGFGESWDSIDPFSLLQRIRILEGRPVITGEAGMVPNDYDPDKPF